MVFLPGAGQLPPLVPCQYQQGVFVSSCNRSADRRESAAATLSRLGHRRRPRPGRPLVGLINVAKLPELVKRPQY